MSLARSLRQQPFRRAIETLSTSSLPRHQIARQQRRCLHQVPPLPLAKQFEENGVGKMLSPDGYIQAWEEQQSYLLGRLNTIVDEGPDADTHTRNLVIKYARDPSKAMVFNYASQAHNHHFFFRLLTNENVEMSPFFQENVKKSFGSVDGLKKTMIAHANAMFGPGFTWLVARKDESGAYNSRPRLAILNTYLAGTPYPQAHYRLQPVDMNTAREKVTGGTTASLYAQEQNEAGRNALGLHGVRHSPQMSPVHDGMQKPGGMVLAPGGQNLEPLLCVSTWEHVWMYDHGIGGKRRYLEAWWDRVNWRAVEDMWSEGKSMKNSFDSRLSSR